MLRIVKQDEATTASAIIVPPPKGEARHVPPRSTARVALKILELFSPSDPVLGVTEIGRRLGIHKSKVSRLVAALEAEGFLTRTEAGRYCLGLRLYAMGATVPHSRALFEAARSELCEIRIRTGESAHLAVLVDTDVVHLERLHSDRLMKRVLRSTKSPTHATSTGKLLLAHAPAEVCERVIAQGLPRCTPRTITDADELRSELRTIRARGYAINREEFRRGTSSVSVPIFAKDGQCIAAMAVITPANGLSALRMETILQLLRDSAARVAKSAA